MVTPLVYPGTLTTMRLLSFSMLRIEVQIIRALDGTEALHPATFDSGSLGTSPEITDDTLIPYFLQYST